MVINLGKIKFDIERVSLPVFTAKYSEPYWLRRKLPEEVNYVLDFMSKDLKHPSWSYIFRHLKVGEKFGHGRYHKDGMGSVDEIHRLVIFGGESTLGMDGRELFTEHLWEFSGDYQHKSQPVRVECNRLLLRVTDNPLIKYRNRLIS